MLKTEAKFPAGKSEGTKSGPTKTSTITLYTKMTHCQCRPTNQKSTRRSEGSCPSREVSRPLCWSNKHTVMLGRAIPLVAILVAVQCLVGLAIATEPQTASDQHSNTSRQSWRLASGSNLEETVVSRLNLEHQQHQHLQHATSISTTISEEANALMYLQRYGYMNAQNSEANNLISEDSLSSAIISFQRFAGITETGNLDEETRRYMKMPRCGNPDQPVEQAGFYKSNDSAIGVFDGRLPADYNMNQHQHSRRESGLNLRPLLRQKRYALQGSKWRRQELTYRISQYPTRFNSKRHEVDSQISKAFGIWSKVAPIDFIVKKDGRVHIDIRFASGDHGDGDAFDGPGNTLAHAYFPQYGGDAHFDDQEYWTIDSYTGTNIFQVAAHELGHSLGLGHSNVREALMAPFYQKYKPNFKLHLDDILAIQALYGEKSFLSSPGPEPVAPTKPSANFPAPGRSGFEGRFPPVAAATTTTTAATSTTTMAASSTTTPATPSTTTTTTTDPLGPPTGIRPRPSWFGAPKHHQPDISERGEDDSQTGPSPDMTGYGENGIGGGTNFNAYDDKSIVPSAARGDFGGFKLPAELCTDSVIDAITRTEDGSTYMFKGDFYWLLNNEGLAKGYPRRISLDWDGLLGSVDAALTWADGKTFFFKGNKYWRFRNRKREVGYPKLISSGFAGIPDDIDAAFVWSGNGRTYFFKGTEYWRFDSKADPPVSAEYPRSIKVWNGVPFHLNAAFKWENNVTYFFKGSQYYRFNDRDFMVETRGRPPFPRLTAEWWFGCVTSNSLAQRASPSEPLGSTARNSDWSLLANRNIRHESKTVTVANDIGSPSESTDVISGQGRESVGPPEFKESDANNNNWQRINFQHHHQRARSASSSAISNREIPMWLVCNLLTLVGSLVMVYSSWMTRRDLNRSSVEIH